MTESIVLPAREAIHAYVANVRHHLSDLPAEEMDELLGGLEADLAERATELPDGADLTSSFGTPEWYAAELRSAAGLPPRVVPTETVARVGVLRQFEAWLRSTREKWTARFPWLSDLRPVWWLVRGFVLAYVFIGIVLSGRVDGRVLIGLVGAALSFWWGRRQSAQVSTWPNRLTVAANAFTALAVLPVMASMAPTTVYVETEHPVAVGYPGGGGDGVYVNGEAATNLYAYDADGNRLDRVRLFNQYGQAVAVPYEGLEQIDQDRINRGEQALPRANDGTPDVNRLVFPLVWGDRTGWEASSGNWEPPVKISSLPVVPGATDSSDPSPSPIPSPSVSPTAPDAPSDVAPEETSPETPPGETPTQ